MPLVGFEFEPQAANISLHGLDVGPNLPDILLQRAGGGLKSSYVLPNALPFIEDLLRNEMPGFSIGVSTGKRRTVGGPTLAKAWRLDVGTLKTAVR